MPLCTDTLDNLPVAVIIFDNTRIFYINRFGQEILGVKKPCDFSKKKVSVFDFLLPEYQKSIRANNTKILSGKPHQRLDFKIKNLKGKELHLESNSSLIYYKGKKAIQTTILEVTEHKSYESELKEVREKFDIISNNAHDIIYFFSYSPKPHYLYISSSVEKVLGYKVENFYKDPFFINKKTIGKDNELKKHEKQAIAQQKNNSLKQKKVVYKMIGKDGNEIWMEDHILPIKDEAGKIKFLFGIVRNISDLKEKENELNQKWSDYRELLNQAPMAFFIHRNGYCEMCNKEAIKILKVKSPEAILGTYLIDYIIPSMRQQVLERMKDVLRGKELDFIPYKITDSKGKVVNIELKSVPIKYNGNNCVLTIIQDVTAKEIYAKEKLRAELAEEHNKGLIKEIALRKKAEEKLLENEKQLINQAAKLSAIFESSSHLVWTVNKKFELTYYNQNYFQTFRNKYSINPVIGRVAFDLIPDEFKNENKSLWHPLYRRVLNGEQIVFERKDKNDKGEDVYREVFLSPIKSEKGEVFEVACLAHDITENKKFEKQNIEQAAKMKAIFESGTSTIWTVDRNGIYTSFNRNFAEAVKLLYGKYPEVGKKMIELKGEEKVMRAREFWNQKQKEAFSGKVVEFMAQLTSPINGKPHYQQIYLRPIFDKNNAVTEISGIGFDVTDKVTNEQKIVSQAAKLNAVFDGSSHYIWTVTKDGKLTSFNKNFSSLIKHIYKTEPKEGMCITAKPFISDEEYNEWWNAQFEKVFNGERLNFETALIDDNRKKTYLDVYLNPIYHKNNIMEVSGIAHDITDRINHEEKIKQSLQEKEVLLKEVHHRVKNNMQVISSILNLQSSYVTDSYALNLLKESQNRIKTMAYIHESLYQNKTFTSINFSEYISTLTSNILQSYTASAHKVELKLDVQKIILGLDTSIPAGLIINELVSNSLKHAFTEKNEGIIYINLHTKDNILFLEVTDNGKGFPKDVDYRNTNSLGLQLVNTLTEQLNGIIELKENKYGGTSFFINFPM